MNNKFNENTIQSYVKEILEKTGISQLDTDQISKFSKEITSQFEKVVGVVSMESLDEINKIEITRLIKGNESKNFDKVAEILSVLNNTDFENKITVKLDELRGDILTNFYSNLDK